MKKKLALLLAAIMVVGTLPMTAFASSTNSVDRIVTGKVDSQFVKVPVAPQGTAPVLTFEAKSLNTTPTTQVTFKATLENAKWIGTEDSTFSKLSDTQAIFTLPVVVAGSDKKVDLALVTELTDEGDAKVTIDPMDSVLTGGTYKFANVVGGATTTTVGGTVNITDGGTDLKSIVITETAAGTLTAGDWIKVKLTNGYSFTNSIGNVVVKSFPSGVVTGVGAKFEERSDNQVLMLKVDSKSTSAATISISGLTVAYDEDEVTAGDECEITVSGAGTDKQSVVIGKATTYGVSFVAENKTLPTFYSGRADKDQETLKVTFKENVKNSWLVGRKTTITFPVGVKVVEVENIKGYGTVADSAVITKVEDNVVTLGTTAPNSSTNGGKAKIDMQFTLSIAPDFTGDIEAVLGGAGVEEDMKAVIGTAVAPVVVTAETNSVSIDYRNVSIGDITIKESFAGALEKGKTLALELDEIQFDGTPTVEVVEGDIKIENVDVTDGVLSFDVKTASNKTAGTLKVTDIELYLERNIPAGKYELALVTTSVKDGETLTGSKDGNQIANAYTSDDAYFQNSVKKGGTHKKTIYFDKRSVTVLKDFVEVVTAGRETADATFTTTIAVTIGANTMVSGKNTVALDVPAYIANGYTMLPVRAVTEALSGAAIVRWDDATRTVTITAGSRVISMTVGSKVMVINGVEVAMQAACEITDSRAFLPLRDLGYALGLNDAKIKWDDATKTATLN